MEEIVSLCKRRGFIFPGSDIYGGVAGLYDFGPYGVELLNNLKQNWWKHNIQVRPDYVGLDSAMFKNPEVWKASGHVDSFSDPMAECKECHTRIRVDKELEKLGVFADEKMTEEEISKLFDEHKDKIKCPNCKKQDWTAPKKFNLLVKSNLGDFTEQNTEPTYLPGEAHKVLYSRTDAQNIAYRPVQIRECGRGSCAGKFHCGKLYRFVQSQKEFLPGKYQPRF